VAPWQRYKLSWHSPWLYLLIFFALILYAIVAAIVRKTAVVDVGLCARHQKRVLWGRIIGWGGLALEIALVWIGLSSEMPLLAIAALLLALPWIIATVVVNRLVLPVRIDERYVRLKGCGPEFLRSLPDRTWQ
jgi:predicted cobalt transporter CbtA